MYAGDEPESGDAAWPAGPADAQPLAAARPCADGQSSTEAQPFADAQPTGNPAVDAAGGIPLPASAAEALRLASAAMDYLNSPAMAGLDGTVCGEVLTALAQIQAKFTAAHAALLRRFDAAGAHDADGCASSSAWLAANAGMSKRDARASVRQMRQLGERPRLARALAAGAVSQSWAAAIADWTRRLPAPLRDETDRIILDAAACGVDLDDLATIAGLAIEKWRSQRPDQDEDEDRFRDRYLRLGVTFGGAAVIRGDLTPECAAAVTAVLESLGKRRGPEDDRTQEQRYHDGLKEACDLLIRARMVPDRAGADTQAVVHIPIAQLRDMPGAPELEDAWIRARLGEPGCLAGKDAEVAACDALTVPVVTGCADMTVIDKIVALTRITLAAGDTGEAGETGQARDTGEAGDTRTAGDTGEARGTGADDPAGTAGVRLGREAWRAHRYAIARLAIEFVSGPGGLASVLRTGLLEHPWNKPSLPLDIGYADSIPGHIRRAVTLRDRHCSWPGGCDRPASACDVHHIRHKADGGETSLDNCALFCEYHHETCIHRWGWQVLLHPDGTKEARSPDGRKVLRSHAPPPYPRD